VNIKQRILSQQLYLNIRYVNIFVTYLEYYVIDMLLSDFNKSLYVKFFFSYSILKNTLINTISNVIEDIFLALDDNLKSNTENFERINIIITQISKYTFAHDRLPYTI